MPLVSRQQKLPRILDQLNLIALFYVIFSGIFLGIYHAWKIQTPSVLYYQWVAFGMLSLVLFATFVLSKRKGSDNYYYLLIAVQILTYITYISYIVYTQRGMASSAIILYIIPILIAAVTRASWVVFGTAILSATAYCLSAIKYFKDFPSEGYKAELYGQMLFYFLILLLVARLIHVVLAQKNSKN